MLRRSFLHKAAAAAASPAILAPARRRPNVVLLITDDQGYGDLGCTGNPLLRTPHLDRLYRESLRFTNFHVESLCAPSRAALLTGRYPFRTGVSTAIGGWSTLRPEEQTAADLFAANGYRTALFGKWHLGDNAPYRPQERGFQETLTFGAGAISTVADYWGNDYFDDTYWRNGSVEKVRGYCTDVFFREGLRFIEENRNRPFFLYLPVNAPHSPYLVEDRYSAAYRKPGIPDATARFYGMISNIDENLGRLRKRLAELQLARDTIFIFMTDNGTTAGYSTQGAQNWAGYNAGMRGKKSTPYDGGHRVPFFLHWPGGGFHTGRDIGCLAAHIDLLPTLADLCRLRHSPAGDGRSQDSPAHPEWDGRSLLPRIQRQDDWPDDRAHFVQNMQLAVNGGNLSDNPQPFVNSAILTRRWRLVNGEELYDHIADPGQQHNIAAGNPEVVKALRAVYEKWWENVEPGIRQPVPLELGHPSENPTRLTCYEWHTPQWLAWQRDIIAGKQANGYWEVRLPRPGRYRFALRKFPREAPAPIDAAVARLRLGDRQESRRVEPGAVLAAFEWTLAAGSARMQTWLDEKHGAYYVDAAYLGQ